MINEQNSRKVPAVNVDFYNPYTKERNFKKEGSNKAEFWKYKLQSKTLEKSKQCH